MSAESSAVLVAAIMSTGAMVSSYLNRRRLGVIHKTFNSRMDRLLELTAESAHAKGMKDQREEDLKKK